MELKINLKQHLKMLKSLFFCFVVCGVFVYFFLDFLGHIVIYFCLFFFFLYVVPVIILHYNYYKNDEGTIYLITNSSFIQKKKNIEKNIGNSEVIQIKIVMTTSKFNQSGYQSLPFADYYFAYIKMKDDTEIILTSLLSSELDVILRNHFNRIPITYDKTLFPIIIKDKGNP